MRVSESVKAPSCWKNFYDNRTEKGQQIHTTLLYGISTDFLLDNRDKQDNQIVPIVRFVHNFFKKFYNQRFQICRVRCVKSKRKKQSCVNMQSHFTQLTHRFSILFLYFLRQNWECRWKACRNDTFDRSLSVCQKYLCVTFAESNKGGVSFYDKLEFIFFFHFLPIHICFSILIMCIC